VNAKPYRVERDWPGQTVVIIGGGTSLTLEQLRTVAMARLAQKCRVIAVNDAAFVAWWADWLHACDEQWWTWHGQVARRFPGTRTTVCPGVLASHVTGYLQPTGISGFDPDPASIRTGGNSVYQAMHIAIQAGAKRIGLVGVDMKAGPDGRMHWFGEHPDMIRPDFAADLAPHFASLKPTLAEREIEVMNASPGSALTDFSIVPLGRIFE
jgi:hypothetical protein